MSNEWFSRNKEIRAFLLGQLSESERTDFETLMIGDESCFDAVTAVEDELIEEYVRGLLSATETVAFETNLLRTERQRVRVAMMRELVGPAPLSSPAAVVAEDPPGWFSNWRAIFLRPAFGLGFGVVLVLLFGGLWLLRSGNGEVARRPDTLPPTPTPTPSVSPTQRIASPTPVADRLPPADNRSATPTATPTSSPTPKTQLEAVFAVVVPTIAGTRGGGKTATVTISRATQAVDIFIPGISKQNANYSVVVIDQDAREVFSRSLLSGGRKSLLVRVPAAKLPEGDYLVRIASSPADVTDYQFRVEKR